jgi:preprotein translocase subunit SecA
MYHKLAGMTGTAETEAAEFWEIYKLDVVTIPTNRKVIRQDHEDKVYKTVKEKFNAVVEEIQSMVAQGRPVLVGTTSVENSEILSRMLQFRKIPHQVLNAKQHAREAEIVAFAGKSGAVTIATNMAGRGTDIKLTSESRAAGGLAIIGTERHESRRVDRQLRGRAGRQGDPGSSQFFVSLEDNLMRLFGAEKIAKVMDRIGLDEGEVIQHSMITNSIQRAQKKVEENNFSMRKRLLEYDDIMNQQRNVIYKRRKNALEGERLQLDITNIFYEVAQNIIETTKDNYPEFRISVLEVFGIESPFAETAFLKGNIDQLTNELYSKAYLHYQSIKQDAADKILPIARKVYTEQGDRFKDMIIPVTDGRRVIQVSVNLEETNATSGKNLLVAIEQAVTLHVIDQNWKDHLREMDNLKQQVQNAVFEQKDPLLIYKFEAFELFKNFLGHINLDTLKFLTRIALEPVQNQPAQAKIIARAPLAPRVTETKAETTSSIGATSSDGLRELAEMRNNNEIKINKPLVSQKIYKRNDKVTVKYMDGSLKQNVKYKNVESDIAANKCVVVSS